MPAWLCPRASCRYNERSSGGNECGLIEICAFVSNRTGDDEIYVVDVDRGQLVQLTRNPGRDADPAWSPDGTKIAFDSAREGAVSIFVMDEDGTNITRLTHGSEADASPSWSPDGSRIAFYRDLGNGSHIFLIDVDGNHLREVTS
jgi:TolB protein